MTVTGIMLITTQLLTPLSLTEAVDQRDTTPHISETVSVRKQEPPVLPDLRLKLNSRVELAPTIEADRHEHLSSLNITISF